MRAWQLHTTDGPSSYTLGEAPVPQPGPGEVRVRLRTIALNHLDLWVSRGLPKPRHFPHTAGADGAGVIDALGEHVDGAGVHDEVVINPSISCGRCRACLSGDVVYCRSFGILGEHLPGTMAEYVVVPARNAVPRPPDVSWEVAGSFGLVTGTAYRMLRRARLRAGETLLVVGIGGGVSSAAMLLGIAMGARVFVTSRNEEKIDWALQHGAEGGFPSEEEFSKGIKSATGGADVVVENVGPTTWDQSVRSLKPGGRLVTCGGTSGNKVELTIPVLFFKQLEILGSSMFNHDEFDDVLGLVATGAIEPPVDQVFDFSDLHAALKHLDAAEQLGKVVLRLE